jgi:hypothetical protein
MIVAFSVLSVNAGHYLESRRERFAGMFNEP